MNTSSLFSVRVFICNSIAAIFLLAGVHALAKDSDSAAAQSSAGDGSSWQGFYVGLHAGGQFGESKTTDMDDWNGNGVSWKNDENGFVGGGQLGYNFQWGRFVAGP